MTRFLRTVAFGSLILALAGCAQAPRRVIVLSSTAAIRAPLVAAKVHVARALAIGKQEQAIAADAVTKGIAAGSEEARELSSLLVADAGEKKASQDQMSASLYQAGELDREQARKQAQIDALAKHDAAQTARVAVLTKSRVHWEFAVLALVLADFIAGGVIQNGLRGAAALIARVIFAFGRHLIAFWPVLLAVV